MERARFPGCELEGANFSGANLSFADFRTATGLAFVPERVKLKKTQIELEAMLTLAVKLGLKVSL